MNMTRTTLIAAAYLALGGAAFAQTPNAQSSGSLSSGGPDAKGNAPFKASHTVNDGGPKGGATSFTRGQARQHILNSGYSAVSALAKGQDGVWRGMATRNGATVPVALDFKGNVTQAPAH